MKRSTQSIYYLLILFSFAFTFSSCKKDDASPEPEPEVYQEKDPRLVVLRDLIMKIENYNLTGIKPDVQFSDFSKDGVGPLKGEEIFTLAYVKTIDPTKMRPLKYIDSKPYAAMDFISNPVMYKRGGGTTEELFDAIWFRNIRFIARPGDATDDFAAMVTISESMTNQLNDNYSLWRVQYVIPKK